MDLPANEAEWRSVLSLSSAQLVTPMLHWAYREQGLISELPADVLEFLDAIYQLNLENNRLHADQLAQLIRALNNIAVQPVLLKGAATLVGGLYPTSGERMIGDIDVLLPLSKLAEAVDQLCSLGYKPILAEETLPDTQNLGLHHYRPLVSHHWPAQVELHVHPVHLQAVRILDIDEVIRDATPLNWRDGNCLLPSATHFVMHNVIHAYVDLGYRYFLSLRQLFEFVYTCRTRADQIDWAVIQQRAESLGYGNALRSYVALATAYLGFRTPSALTRSVWDPARRQYFRMQLKHPAMYFLFLLLVGPLRLYARTLIKDPRAMKRLLSVRGYMNLYQLAKTQTPP